MHSTSIYGLKLSVLRVAGGKAQATNPLPCYTRRVVTTIFSNVIAQRRVAINIILTLFQMAAKFFQHCNDMFCVKLENRMHLFQAMREVQRLMSIDSQDI